MLFIEILVGCLLGTLIGCVSASIGGIHINLISSVILALLPLLSEYSNIVSSMFIVAAWISLAITHTFVDAIPSTYLGASANGHEMHLAPAHQFLLSGKGHQAVFLASVGSFFALVFSCVIALPLFFLMQYIAVFVGSIVGYLLIIVLVFLFRQEKEPATSVIVFLLAGLLGIVVLQLPMKQALLPLLGGLFGTSMLLMSITAQNTMPKQSLGTHASVFAKPSLIATGLGAAAAFLPGLGSSQVSILASHVANSRKKDIFMILIGGINTSSVLLSLVAMFALSKARNGAIAMMMSAYTFTFDYMLYFMLICLVSACFATVMTMIISTHFTTLFRYVPYRGVLLFALVITPLLTILLDGWLGFFVLVCSTMVGLYTIKVGSAKHYLMGCLILNLIIFFV